MRQGRTTIPAWEIPMLQAIADGRYSSARHGALERYIHERERRRRYARVRDAKDRERRTLVGAHMSKADADLVKFMADREDLSVTAFVRHALRQAMENSELGREIGDVDVFAVTVRRPYPALGRAPPLASGRA